MRLLGATVEDVKSEYGQAGNIDALVAQYRDDWEHSCVVIVGRRAERHALRLSVLCTCRECILYASCEHTVFVDGLDLPVRVKLRDFNVFAS